MTTFFLGGWRWSGRLVGCLVGLFCLALLGVATPAAAQDDAPQDSVSATQDDAAQDPDPFARDGGYFIIGGGLSLAHGGDRDGKIVGPDTTVTGVNADSKGGFTGRIGRRFHPHLAAELQFEFAQANFTSDLGAGDAVLLVTTANLRAPILTGRIQPFALVGLGVIQNTTTFAATGTIIDDFNAVLRAGGGVDVYLTEGFALTADATYVLPTGSLSDSDFLSISGGVLLRF